MVILVYVRWYFLAELPYHGWSKEALAGHSSSHTKRCIWRIVLFCVLGCDDVILGEKLL
jgi:hypothetical protein